MFVDRLTFAMLENFHGTSAMSVPNEESCPSRYDQRSGIESKSVIPVGKRNPRVASKR
jgi:hypothetical protein